MSEINSLIEKAISGDVFKIIISNPKSSDAPYRKTVIEKTDKGYSAESFTEKQAFHKAIAKDELFEFLSFQSDSYRQFNIWTANAAYEIRISKKGKAAMTAKRVNNDFEVKTQHNKKKNYIIPEGIIPPLIDMGIFSQQGKVINSMQDKYRQINRFVEIIDDEITNMNFTDTVNIIDFGCGKSYLTFILYYYLTEIKKLDVNITGLDLKKEVIENCNKAAVKYGYTNLHFEPGDINGYKTDKKIHMVITLHACDTATDYALCNAVSRDADLIFSVPCCQHELNKQIKTDSLSLITRYGIIKERTAALLTDAIRANLLEYAGYKTQVLEFIDMQHTPKNIMLRAVKKKSNQNRNIYLKEVEKAMQEFSLNPTLYNLLVEK